LPNTGDWEKSKKDPTNYVALRHARREVRREKLGEREVSGSSASV
jgi:hypothetical protein